MNVCFYWSHKWVFVSFVRNILFVSGKRHHFMPKLDLNVNQIPPPNLSGTSNPWKTSATAAEKQAEDKWVSLSELLTSCTWAKCNERTQAFSIMILQTTKWISLNDKEWDFSQFHCNNKMVLMRCKNEVCSSHFDVEAGPCPRSNNQDKQSKQHRSRHQQDECKNTPRCKSLRWCRSHSWGSCHYCNASCRTPV